MIVVLKVLLKSPHEKNRVGLMEKIKIVEGFLQIQEMSQLCD